MPFAFNLYLLYNYSKSYETSPFCSDGSPRNEGSAADYMFMLLIGAGLLALISYFYPVPFMGTALVFMVLYVWSRRHPTQPCSFFGFKFNGQYLPWVYTAFSVLIGKSPMMNLLGIGVGHVYYFFLKIAPVTYGWNIIKTPRFLYVSLSLSLSTREPLYVTRRSRSRRTTQDRLIQREPIHTFVHRVGKCRSRRATA